MVAEVAEALQDLKEEMIFVGGSIISVYTDDAAADEVRPTGDIDMTIQLSGYGEWVKLQDRLLSLGFSPNPEGHNICNYLYNGIAIDIMPMEDSSIGKSNRWYKPGLNDVQAIEIENQRIKILSAPYFLATKFEAFNNRGNDYRLSHDFEDIIYVIDNRTSIVNEVLEADNTVKAFIVEELNKVMSQSNWQEILSSQIHPLMTDQRFPIVVDKIKSIINPPLK